MPSSSDRSALLAAYTVRIDSRGEDDRAWLALADDSFVVHTPAADGSPEAAALPSGKAGLAAYLGAIAANWDRRDYVVDSVEEEGDVVTVGSHCVWRSRRTGADAALTVNHRWRFRGGKAVEMVETYDAAPAIQAGLDASLS